MTPEFKRTYHSRIYLIFTQADLTKSRKYDDLFLNLLKMEKLSQLRFNVHRYLGGNYAVFTHALLATL